MFNIPFHCERSITINRHISVVAPVIGDFNTWKNWSPWVCMEPECDMQITGGINEVGHAQSWDGDRIGAGNMVMTAKSDTQFSYDLEFIKPWKSKSAVTFSLEGHGGDTKVTWTMRGGISVFMFFAKRKMRAAVENDYDRGLMMLKDYAEEGHVASETILEGLEEKAGFHYIGFRRSASLDDMATEMSKDFGQMTEWVTEGELQEPDRYMALYHKFDMVNRQCDFTSVLAYDERPENPKNLLAGIIPDHSVLRATHTGAYKFLGNAWSTVMAEQTGQKLKLDKKAPSYEVYVNSPSEAIPEELITEINVPISLPKEN